MDYKKISNELLFTYHKNIDFVYKVLGEFLYNTQNFSRKYSKVYKTSEGKVFVSWDKSNEWNLKLNESLSKSDIKLSIKESNEDHFVDAYPGDYVDFGPYGKLYICKDLGDKYWVTDEAADAGNPNAQGWFINKDLARSVILSNNEDDEFDESVNESLIPGVSSEEEWLEELRKAHISLNKKIIKLTAEYESRGRNTKFVTSDYRCATNFRRIEKAESALKYYYHYNSEKLNQISDEIYKQFNESKNESISPEYKMVEYTYDGDEISDYLGHVRVRTDSDKVALRAAEKYIMNKQSERNPRHFKISDDKYNNVDVIDSDGDFLTKLRFVNESKYTSSLTGSDSLVIRAEEAYFDNCLDDFVADVLNDGSATKDDLLNVVKESSVIELDDILNAINKAK